MHITKLKWLRDIYDQDSKTLIRATINDMECFVPVDEANKEYREISKLLDAGDLTIEDADPSIFLNGKLISQEADA